MAQNKKSFIAYTDWNEIFKKLTDDEAGKLAKMIFAYVSDEDPSPPDRITELIFEPIKQHLKRDLQKYENIKRNRAKAGKKGGLKSGKTRSKPTENEANEASASIASKNEANEADNVNDNDNDNVNDNVKDYRKVLLSEVSSDVVNQEYFEAAKSFQELFKQNLEEAGASTAIIDKAKGTWIDDIRLMIEADKYSMDDLRGAYVFLQKNEFWKKNILSTKKLRERMPRIKMEMHNGKSRGNNKEATSWDELAEIVKHSFEGS